MELQIYPLLLSLLLLLLGKELVQTLPFSILLGIRQGLQQVPHNLDQALEAI